MLFTIKKEIKKFVTGSGGLCILGRNKAFCCDPPEGFDNGFLPVPLDHLFPPEYLPKITSSTFAEAFDKDPDQEPRAAPFSGDNPNAESFGWFVLASEDSDDIASFVRRDGSLLELFDCPHVAQDDHGPQFARAVCMSKNPADCEEIRSGGVKGTIIRLVRDQVGYTTRLTKWF
jgi:chitinase